MTMMCEHDRTTAQSTLELIWDEDLNATALTDGAAPIRIGPATNLLPHLITSHERTSNWCPGFPQGRRPDETVVWRRAVNGRWRVQRPPPCELR